MSRGIQYKQEIEKTKANLAGVRKRGENALESWDDLEKELFTPEEIAASDLRVAMMIENAHEKSAAYHSVNLKN